MQNFSDESICRQSPFDMHLHKIVTILKILTLKFNIFDYIIAKSHSAAGVFAPRSQVPPAAGDYLLHPAFLYYSHTALLKNTLPWLRVFE